MWPKPFKQTWGVWIKNEMRNAIDVMDFVAVAGAAACTLLVSARILLLKRTGLRVNTLGHKKTGLHRALEMLVLPLAFITLLEIILHATHSTWHLFQPRDYGMWFDLPALRLAGGVCLAAAWLVLFQALRDFGYSYRLGVDQHNPGKLVTHGIFSYSRNPVYLGIEIFFLGQFLIFPNAFFFWMLLGAVGFMHFLIRREERQLAVLHGEAYARYAQRVPRYFGFKRKR
jgi:protein-S-isoprenylcysteine O-methyltransferase Ste14